MIFIAQQEGRALAAARLCVWPWAMFAAQTNPALAATHRNIPPPKWARAQLREGTGDSRGYAPPWGPRPDGPPPCTAPTRSRNRYARRKTPPRTAMPLPRPATAPTTPAWSRRASGSGAGCACPDCRSPGVARPRLCPECLRLVNRPRCPAAPAGRWSAGCAAPRPGPAGRAALPPA